MHNFSIFLICCGFVAAGAAESLQCYDCDYSKFPKECKDPKTESVPFVNCNEEYPNLGGNETLICVSVYVQVSNNDNMTGVARGCKAARPDVGDFCDWYRQETNNGTITISDCVTCNSTKCNDRAVSRDGSFSAAVAFHCALLALVLNALVCVGAL